MSGILPKEEIAQQISLLTHNFVISVFVLFHRSRDALKTVIQHELIIKLCAKAVRWQSPTKGKRPVPNS